MQEPLTGFALLHIAGSSVPESWGAVVEVAAFFSVGQGKTFGARSNEPTPTRSHETAAESDLLRSRQDDRQGIRSISGTVC